MKKTTTKKTTKKKTTKKTAKKVTKKATEAPKLASKYVISGSRVLEGGRVIRSFRDETEAKDWVTKNS